MSSSRVWRREQRLDAVRFGKLGSSGCDEFGRPARALQLDDDIFESACVFEVAAALDHGLQSVPHTAKVGRCSPQRLGPLAGKPELELPAVIAEHHPLVRYFGLICCG